MNQSILLLTHIRYAPVFHPLCTSHWPPLLSLPKRLSLSLSPLYFPIIDSKDVNLHPGAGVGAAGTRISDLCGCGYALEKAFLSCKLDRKRERKKGGGEGELRAEGVLKLCTARLLSLTHSPFDEDWTTLPRPSFCTRFSRQLDYRTRSTFSSLSYFLCYFSLRFF